MSRSRRAVRTYLASVLAAAVTMLLGFAATPYLLEWLGGQRWGAYRAVLELIALLQILELGLSTALTAGLAKAIAHGDRQRQKELLVHGVRRYFLVGLTAIGVGILVLPWIQRLIPVSDQMRSELLWAVGLLLGSQLLLAAQPFRLYLETLQRGDLVNVAMTVQGVLVTTTALLLAYFGWGLPGQAVAHVIGIALGTIAIWGGFRWFGPRLGRDVVTMAVSKDVSADARQLQAPAFAVTLCGRASLAVDSLIVSSMLSPAAVVPFFLTQRLAQVVTAQVNGVANATWPGMAEIYHSGQQDRFKSHLITLTRGVTAFGVCALLPVLVWNRDFVRIWVGGDRYAGLPFTAVAVLNALALSVIVCWTMVLRGTGQLRSLVPVSIAQAVVNLGLSVGLTCWLGIIGPILGTFISLVTVTLWGMPIVLAQTFGVRVGELAKAVLWPLCLGAVQWLLWQGISAQLDVSGWMELLCGIAATGWGSVAVMYLVATTESERQALMQRLARFVPAWATLRRTRSPHMFSPPEAVHSEAQELTPSVLIVSYRRPAALRNCLAALQAQHASPDEVIVVWQGDDEATREAAQSMRNVVEFSLMILHLPEPGIVPAENLALDHSQGDVILLIDDDAVAPPDWLAKHVAFYVDPTVGAVGGSADNTTVDGPLPKCSREPIGRISWCGRLYGNMHDHVESWQTRPPIEVDHLVGYNLSLRRSAFDRFDDNLKRYWQMFELDACLQVQARGGRVIFDFNNSVRHYPTNTAYRGGREGDLEVKVLNGVFNRCYIYGKHLHGARRLAAMLYQTLVGSVNAPGLIAMVAGIYRYGQPLREARLLLGSWRAAENGWRLGSSRRERNRDSPIRQFESSAQRSLKHIV